MPTAPEPSAQLDAQLDDLRHEFRRLKKAAEDALAQVDDDDLDVPLDEESNSLAILVKHMAGNLRSRWRDFLTTDGEKPDRHRDSEFELDADGDSPDSLRRRWEEGWEIFFDTADALSADDLGRTITIRGEPHTVHQALLRGFGHYAYHVGQIVQLARHLAGESWRSLSIPKGGSEAFRAAPKPYLDK